MADLFNRLLNDSEKAAQVYSGLVEDSNVDSKMWDFEEIRKDHEQIAGHIKRTPAQTGTSASGRGSGGWPPVKRHRAVRLYEDLEALKTLRDAEQSELDDCEKLMAMGEGDRMSRTVVANEVMPVLISHLETLDGYIQRAQTLNRDRPGA